MDVKKSEGFLLAIAAPGQTNAEVNQFVFVKTILNNIACNLYT